MSSPRNVKSSGYLTKVLLNSKTNKKTSTDFCSSIKDLENGERTIYDECVRDA